MEAVQQELARVCADEYPRLVGLLALQVGDRRVAEELAQDTLLALCRHWTRVERPTAWLTRVGLNRANSWLRRRLAERRAQARHGPTAAIAEDEGPGRMEADELRRRVAALPRRQRTAVALRFYEQHTVAEAAAVMGCAEGTVKALTHQAVTRLREQEATAEERTHG